MFVADPNKHDILFDRSGAGKSNSTSSYCMSHPIVAKQSQARHIVPNFLEYNPDIYKVSVPRYEIPSSSSLPMGATYIIFGSNGKPIRVWVRSVALLSISIILKQDEFVRTWDTETGSAVGRLLEGQGDSVPVSSVAGRARR